MNKLIRILVPAVFVFALCASSGLSEGQEIKASLRLMLDLSDGSRVIGVPNFAFVNVQTDYAKMNIPLKQIRKIKIADDHETAMIDLTNGDRLNGAIIFESIKIETVFGRISLTLDHVTNITVNQVAGGILPATLKDKQILFYSFDQDNGKKVMDISGKGNNGRFYGAKWVPKGRLGGACEFSGHGDYIDAGSTPDWDFDISKDWTFSFWIYPQGSLSSMCFYHRAGVNHTLNGGENYLCYQTESVPAGLSWGPVNEEWDTGVLLSLNQWQHIAMLYSAQSRRAFLYVNGVEKANVPVHSVGRSAGSLLIGDNANINFFKGMMDEIMIFNCALSGNDVKELYDSQK
jgi:hypothetical protein